MAHDYEEMTITALLTERDFVAENLSEIKETLSEMDDAIERHVAKLVRKNVSPKRGEVWLRRDGSPTKPLIETGEPFHGLQDPKTKQKYCADGIARPGWPNEEHTADLMERVPG